MTHQAQKLITRTSLLSLSYTWAMIYLIQVMKIDALIYTKSLGIPAHQQHWEQAQDWHEPNRNSQGLRQETWSKIIIPPIEHLKEKSH